MIGNILLKQKLKMKRWKRGISDQDVLWFNTDNAAKYHIPALSLPLLIRIGGRGKKRK